MRVGAVADHQRDATRQGVPGSCLRFTGRNARPALGGCTARQVRPQHGSDRPNQESGGDSQAPRAAAREGPPRLGGRRRRRRARAGRRRAADRPPGPIEVATRSARPACASTTGVVPRRPRTRSTRGAPRSGAAPRCPVHRAGRRVRPPGRSPRDIVVSDAPFPISLPRTPFSGAGGPAFPSQASRCRRGPEPILAWMPSLAAPRCLVRTSFHRPVERVAVGDVDEFAAAVPGRQRRQLGRRRVSV